MPPTHLLTVLHAAERSGPPMFALQYLRWLATHEPGVRFSTVFLDTGGPIEPDFAELGPTLVAGTKAPWRKPHARIRAAVWHSRRLRLRRLLGAHGPVSLTHVHCAGSFKVVPALPPGPILGHLHELSVGQDLHLGPTARRYVTVADRYVAVADGVRDEFLGRFDVEPERVERQWGFVDPERIPQRVDRRTLGWDDDDVVVLSSGVRNWRKAPELFVAVAAGVIRRRPDVRWRFVWLGGGDTPGLDDALGRSPLAGSVVFVPHQPDAMAWIAAADLFVLPAREDAFPLVCVEAASAATPIVTFDNGGAADLVHASGCGTVVGFPDVDAMARAIVDLALDRDRSRRLGDRGREFARRELTVDVAAPRLWASTRATIEEAARGTRRDSFLAPPEPPRPPRHRGWGARP
ncbi:MAG: glycosyltransferase family 4 protein [Microthrixaceae bacterium]